MKIACLGWGSLLWKSGSLALASGWHDDGPVLPIEFARVADGGELSTALCDGAAPQSTWWALLATTDLHTAREQLREREEIDIHHAGWVGSLPGDPGAPHAATIDAWRGARGLDAVIWTALPPKIDRQEGLAPDPVAAVRYLRGLRGDEREHAERYIRKVPATMSTLNRRTIERELGWTPVDARGGRG